MKEQQQQTNATVVHQSTATTIDLHVDVNAHQRLKSKQTT